MLVHIAISSGNLDLASLECTEFRVVCLIEVSIARPALPSVILELQFNGFHLVFQQVQFMTRVN